MIYEVRIGTHLSSRIVEVFGPERSGGGRPSEWDFWSGPLAAALVAFRDFDALRFDDVPAIRSLHFVDPVFGPLVFVGVLIGPALVELAEVSDDPDYWRIIDDNPDD